jgi:ketosteroid isomerase-like protein
MTTKEISDQLVALCRAGRNVEAVETLMSADIVSVEARGDETMPATMTGLEAIRGKNVWWVANHAIHSAEVKGPFPNGDRFSVIFNFVVSPKMGAMAGKKVRMEEVALYTVSDGKIVREEFFYDMSGGGAVAEDKPRKKAKAARKAVAKAKVKPTTKAKTKARAKTAKLKAKLAKSKSMAKGKARRR